MATVSKWTPFGVALDVTATGSSVVRKSATQFTVVVKASWETYYSGAQTNYGMTATSGGVTSTISAFDGTKRSSGSKTFTGTYSISGNGAATKSITVTFKNFNTDNGDSATKNVTFSVSVPAWTSYTVSYNANGGSGAPGSQTKWKDQSLTLSSTKPTRTGHSFSGWALTKADADAGKWYYQPGATCGRNENLTLYAVWKANTYAVNYNANGGSGAPASQTKTYGVALTLSSTKPTRTNYNFKGWGTSASATTATYSAGGQYTANSAVTLYAVWELAYVKPRINGLNIIRTREDGTPDNNGTYALVEFSWACDKAVTSVTIEWKDTSGIVGSVPVAASGTSGSASKIVGNGELDVEKSYVINVIVQDSIDYTYGTRNLQSVKFIMDVLAEGKGVAFDKVAELEGVADIGFKTRLLGGILPVILEPGTDLNTVVTPGIYAGKDTADGTYINCPLTNNSFTFIVDGAGGTTQIRQYIEACNMTMPVKYERYFYGGSWGGWIRLSPTSLRQLINHTPSAANTYELVGSITIPAYKFYTITARGMFNNATCKGVILSSKNNDYKYSYASISNEDSWIHFPSCTYSGVTDDKSLTFYIWGKWAGTSANSVEISGYYLPY